MRGVIGALSRHQARAESLMTLTLTAYAPDGHTTDADGYEVPAYSPKGTTPGKVQAGSQAGSDTSVRTVTVGGVERIVLTAGLHIPVAAPLPVAGDMGIGWEYAVTAVNGFADVALLGARFLVVAAPMKSFATARRLDVVQL